MNTSQFQINRGLGTDNHPYWGIVYEKKDKNKLQTIEIDGLTGRIVGEGEKDYLEGG